MLDEDVVETISQKVLMLVSLTRILESNYNNLDDLTEVDLWNLVSTIKENSQELLDFIKGLQNEENH